MMGWPKRGVDGTVSVAVRVAVGGAEVADAVRLFVAEWIAEKAAVLARDLVTPPYVEVAGEGTVEVVFDGRSDNGMWKDWMVALTGDLGRSVEGVQVLGFNDRVSEHFRPFDGS